MSDDINEIADLQERWGHGLAGLTAAMEQVIENLNVKEQFYQECQRKGVDVMTAAGLPVIAGRHVQALQSLEKQLAIMSDRTRLLRESMQSNLKDMGY